MIYTIQKLGKKNKQDYEHNVHPLFDQNILSNIVQLLYNFFLFHMHDNLTKKKPNQILFNKINNEPNVT